MRRNAVCWSASLIMVLTVVGCKGSGKNPDAALAMDPSDTYTLPAQEQTYGSEPYPVYGSPVQMETRDDGAAAPAAAGPRYHTVAKRDTLYALARMYYNDQRRWRDIYEANRSTISDPNKIRVGQRLVIP